MNAVPRTLSRSLNDRMIAGVMGGIAHRFGWNPTLVRVLYVVISLASAAFPGILIYLLLWRLMPNEADCTPRPGPGRSGCARCRCWARCGPCPIP